METKSHKRKTFMVTILIMIALVIAVGYAWFAYKHKLASLTKVNSPGDVSIAGVHGGEMNGINLSYESKDVSSSKIVTVQNVICIRSNSDKVRLEVAHTQNVEGLVLKLYPATESEGTTSSEENTSTICKKYKDKNYYYSYYPNKGNDSIPNESGIVTYNDTLPLGRNTNTYTVSVPVENLGKVTVEVSVKPDSDSLEWTDNKMLAAEITPVKVSEKIGFECKSGFSDSELNNKQPYDYSAFRYYIEINSGQAQITLKWNDKYVKPDNTFLESLGDGSTIKTDGDYKVIVFTMDYADKSTINTIFYRKKGRNSNEDWQKTWDNMKNVVVVNAKEIKNN